MNKRLPALLVALLVMSALTPIRARAQITLTAESPLDFGRFTPSSTVTGWVRARANGNVSSSNALLMGGQQRGEITIGVNNRNRDLWVSLLPATLVLRNGLSVMTAGNFEHQVGSYNSSQREYPLYIGGRLTYLGTPAAGVYTADAPLMVIVDLL